MSREQKLPRNYMKVTSHGEPPRFIEYGEHILNGTEFKELIVMGAGSSIEVAVKVADQLKQKIFGLHQQIEVGSI